MRSRTTIRASALPLARHSALHALVLNVHAMSKKSWSAPPKAKAKAKANALDNDEEDFLMPEKGARPAYQADGGMSPPEGARPAHHAIGGETPPLRNSAADQADG